MSAREHGFNFVRIFHENFHSAKGAKEKCLLRSFADAVELIQKLSLSHHFHEFLVVCDDKELEIATLTLLDDPDNRR